MKISYFLTDSQVVLLKDYMLGRSNSSTADWADLVYDFLVDYVVAMRSQIEGVGSDEGFLAEDNSKFKITQDEFDTLKIIHDSSFEGVGKKRIWDIGHSLFEKLEDSYKLHILILQKTKKDADISFEKFADGLIGRRVGPLCDNQLRSGLLKERKKLKESKESSAEKKPEV